MIASTFSSVQRPLIRYEPRMADPRVRRQEEKSLNGKPRMSITEYKRRYDAWRQATVTPAKLIASFNEAIKTADLYAARDAFQQLRSKDPELLRVLSMYLARSEHPSEEALRVYWAESAVQMLSLCRKKAKVTFDQAEAFLATENLNPARRAIDLLRGEPLLWYCLLPALKDKYPDRGRWLTTAEEKFAAAGGKPVK